ncbi:hypothetical protein HHL11_27965 [Ramlibacter sp. G-1-2-2]|uniref:Periplasmic heavy metal sensor n=1 Tax=Ramlibacter agri TaxID=2728837 RepID=A0A848HIR9_9BURK|nr:Spy/CpxP family protein refolding chaperone [Ramlibacter agri]NML47618.1 hypothetical protein [Ramlibacter agri]
MKPWKTVLGVIGAVVALGAFSGCSSYRGGHGGWNATPEQQAKHREHVVERVASRLDLNEAQKAKLSDFLARMQAERAAAMASQQSPRAQMLALVSGDKFDRAGAQAWMSKTAAALETRSPAVIASLADFYDSLDATQQAKVREYLQQRRGWRRG